MSRGEKFGYVGLASALLLGVTYVGSQQLKRPAPIVIEQNPTATAPKTVSVSPTLPIVRELVVHVAGAVKKPGVFKFPADGRVLDAIEKAGGTQPDADLESINLAAKLEDATQLYVPHKDTKLNSTSIAPAYSPDKSRESYASKPKSEGKTETHSGAKHPTGVVNLNTASSEQLQTIPGIGPSTAEKIIEYRHEHGGFASVDELTVVKGIGEKKLEKMRKWLTVK